MMLLKRQWKNEDTIFKNDSFLCLWLIDNYHCFNGRYTPYLIWQLKKDVQKYSLLN